MSEVDQFIVYLWFLPVVLFIVIPLCAAAVWVPVALFIKLIRREERQERSGDLVSGRRP